MHIVHREAKDKYGRNRSWTYWMSSDACLLWSSRELSINVIALASEERAPGSLPRTIPSSNRRVWAVIPLGAFMGTQLVVSRNLPTVHCV
jgi:hypothetical protein